jgi:hypothetical protein
MHPGAVWVLIDPLPQRVAFLPTGAIAAIRGLGRHSLSPGPTRLLQREKAGRTSD